MDRFLDDFGQTHFDDLALIRNHVWWPGSQDPFYLVTSGWVSTRVNFYNLNFVPWPAVDGVYVSSNSAFESRFNQRLGTPSDLVMSVDAEAIGDSVAITVEIYAESTPTASDLRLRISATETNIHYVSPYGEVWNEVMRAMVPDANGQLVNISQGDSLEFTGSFTMQPDWDMAEMAVVAFVQSNDTQEILQGARWLAPAGTVTGVVDDGTRAPVEGALVTLLGAGRFDSTNAQGQYTISYLVGDYEIETRAVGHYPDTTMVEILDDSTITVGIGLTPLPTGLFAGTVTDSVTGDGIDARVVLMMNNTPWDSATTNPQSGFFYFPAVPITYPGIQDYTGITIYPELPYPITALNQVITVTEDDTASVFSRLNPAEVLIVDDDEGEDYENYFIAAVDSAGRTYFHLDVFSSGTSPGEAISLFPTSSKVVWYTGDATTNTLTQDDQDSLASFLDAGGKLFLTGQNIAEDLTSIQSSFLDDYVHAGWLENPPQIFLHGKSGDPLGRGIQLVITTGANGANNQTSRDRLEITGESYSAVHFIANPSDLTDLGTAGVWAEGPVAGSRIVLFGFGVEAVNRPAADPSQITRTEMMTLVLDFLDGITGINDPVGFDEAGLPRSYALGQNFPNPFNPQTTISYDVPESEGKGVRVFLSVYNLRGKKVKMLVDSWKEEGRHMVQWDGTSDQGEKLSSGVYLYRLEAGSFTETRKLLLVK